MQQINNNQDSMDNNKQSVSFPVNISMNNEKPKQVSRGISEGIYKKASSTTHDHFGVDIYNYSPHQSIKSQSSKPLQFVPSQMQKNNRNVNVFDNIDCIAPLSLVTTPLLLDGVEEYDDVSALDYASSPSTFTPPSLVPLSNSQFTFDFHNELNSFIIADDKQSPKEVISKLNEILLTNYTENIDFSIDHMDDSIKGTVFITNFHAVSFTIQVWTDVDGNRMGFEFRRNSGDSMASAKLWADIQCFYGNFGNNSKNAMEKLSNFVALDSDFAMLDFSDFADSKQDRLSAAELDEINVCIVQNDQFSLDEMCILYDRITNCANNEMICGDIVGHNALFETIVSTLNNADIAMQRMALLILKELNVCNGDGALFTNVLFQLKNGANLIRRHCIDFLSNLSLSNANANITNARWTFLEISMKMELIELVKTCEIEFSKDLFLNQIMFDNIKRKLDF